MYLIAVDWETSDFAVIWDFPDGCVIIWLLFEDVAARLLAANVMPLSKKIKIFKIDIYLTCNGSNLFKKFLN